MIPATAGMLATLLTQPQYKRDAEATDGTPARAGMSNLAEGWRPKAIHLPNIPIVLLSPIGKSEFISEVSLLNAYILCMFQFYFEFPRACGFV